MIRLALVAALPAMRAGLRAILQTSSNIEVTVEHATLEHILADAAVLAVDAVLLTEDTALEEISEQEQDIPPIAIILLSESSRAVALLQALSLPGWAIVAPDVEPSVLQAAVEAAAQGLVVLSPQLVEEVASETETVAIADPGEPADDLLTAREQEVLDLISQGLPNKLIANSLGISEHTVKFHVSSIYAKLGASNRTEAISRGARRGLVSF
jgi:DNA-binding NarL/FixJ family response regulator